MSRISKYNDISTKRPPRRKRSIRLAGSGEDDGKWYRCWYCGFINNIDRNAVGTGEGIQYTIGQNSNDLYGNGPKVINIGLSGTCVMTTPLDTFNDRHSVAAEAVSGCSFCGSLNYR